MAAVGIYDTDRSGSFVGEEAHTEVAKCSHEHRRYQTRKQFSQAQLPFFSQDIPFVHRLFRNRHSVAHPIAASQAGWAAQLATTQLTTRHDSGAAAGCSA